MKRGLATWGWFSAAAGLVFLAGSLPERFGSFYVQTTWPVRVLVESGPRSGFAAATSSAGVAVVDATLLVALLAWCLWRRTGEPAWRWGGLAAAAVVALAQAAVLVWPTTLELASVETGAWLWLAAGLATTLAFAGSRE